LTAISLGTAQKILLVGLLKDGLRLYSRCPRLVHARESTRNLGDGYDIVAGDGPHRYVKKAAQNADDVVWSVGAKQRPLEIEFDLGAAAPDIAESTRMTAV
jgi:hypothetical protein